MIKYIQNTISLKDYEKGKTHIDSFQFSKVPRVAIIPKKKYLIVKIRAYYFTEFISPGTLV